MMISPLSAHNASISVFTPHCMYGTFLSEAYFDNKDGNRRIVHVYADI